MRCTPPKYLCPPKGDIGEEAPNPPAKDWYATACQNDAFAQLAILSVYLERAHILPTSNSQTNRSSSPKQFAPANLLVVSALVGLYKLSGSFDWAN